MSDDFDNSQLEDDQEDDSLDEKYLTFMLGDEEFGINISFVTEIIGIQAITFVPELPAFVKGIINLRGQIIPVIDVRLRFQKEEIGYNDRTCIIVIQIRDLSIGFIVDSVAACDQIPDSSIIPPPAFQRNYHQKYISGIGRMQDKIILILDCDKLISEDMGISQEAV
ncbi:MAG: chemotaxis protein CheW [Clostridiales bacterium]|jgi:purine-binding chemotaxis protein CheW|nr:chemotaxis protein CheW [Clostridiales bacterium]